MTYSSNEKELDRLAYFWLAIAIGVSYVVASLVSLDSLGVMVREWQREEYSHSYLIPPLALLLVWQKLYLLNDRTVVPSWWGTAFVAMMIGVLLLGELSALHSIVHYAYVGILLGVCIAAFGVRSSWLFSGPLLYLFFMVPLPNFLYFNLSQSLQLISSEIGVSIIRLFGISVFLEGNVIDLGAYKLQVVEACSGLRYLFPLASFAFLIAYLFKAPAWQRVVVFFSALPITVLMNSFRIGVIGVLVEHWGIGMADGFLHYFEGWIIFLACLGILFVELWIFTKFSGGGSVWDRLDLGVPHRADVKLKLLPARQALTPLIVAALLLLGALFVNQSLGNRTEVVPSRTQFLQFPLLQGGWIGRERAVEAKVLGSLKLTDHLMADYRHSKFLMPVNFYVAYYGSQRKGVSVHSPKACLPGGGWEVQSITQLQLPLDNQLFAGSRGEGLVTNRAVIQKGEHRQLVYYWFEQRGRRLTNEYLVKWYLFVDSIFMQRTDGALVRLVVPVPDGKSLEAADAQLLTFLRDFYPLMSPYIPSNYNKAVRQPNYDIQGNALGGTAH